MCVYDDDEHGWHRRSEWVRFNITDHRLCRQPVVQMRICRWFIENKPLDALWSLSENMMALPVLSSFSLLFFQVLSARFSRMLPFLVYSSSSLIAHASFWRARHFRFADVNYGRRKSIQSACASANWSQNVFYEWSTSERCFQLAGIMFVEYS